MFAIAVSTFIEGAELCPTDPMSRTEAGYAIERIVDTSLFEPRFIPATNTGGEFPDITKRVENESDRALLRLRQFKSWPENWDAEGGAKPDRINIDRAIALLSQIATKPISFGVGLDADSRPMFSIRDSAYDGHIVVEPNGAVSFFFQRGTEILDDYDLAFDGQSLPGALEQALKRI